jgi:type I restriction enzyme R subunit
VLNLFDESVLNSILLIDRPNTKIKLLERLLRASLAEFRKTNLAKAVDFSKRLKGVVDAYNDRSESAVMKSHVLDDLAERLAALFRELSAENGISMTLGVTYEERAFFDILKSISEKYDFAYPEESLTSLARAIKTIVDEKSSFTDWANRSDIRAELRVDLILLLDEHGFPPVPKDEIFAEIFEQAENFKLHADRLL